MYNQWGGPGGVTQNWGAPPPPNFGGAQPLPLNAPPLTPPNFVAGHPPPPTPPNFGHAPPPPVPPSASTGFSKCDGVIC